MKIFVSENIKNLRAQKGITQETLADFLGVSFQSVSRWERGEGYPDITMLPSIAEYFGVSVDDLLGADKIQKEEAARKYLEIYDKMKLKDLTYTLSEFKEAVKELPGDFRIIVRYMNLLQEAKDWPSDEGYGKTSDELMKIYENIQKNCTDDAIRIWSKRIIISHLLRKYQCTCNEEGQYYVHKEYLEKAKEIINTLTGISDSKELILMGTAENEEEYYELHKKALQELMYQLSETAFGYFFNYNAEERIKAFEAYRPYLSWLLQGEITEKTVITDFITLVTWGICIIIQKMMKRQF